MGFADMLLYLGIPYNSEEGVALARKAHGLRQRPRPRSASEELAETRGAFPLFDESIYKDGEPLRNATVTTIAPTGTLSIIAGVSSGVEPVFAYAYIRNVMDNTHLIETNQILKDKLVEAGIYSDELMHKIVEQGSLAHVDEIPEDIKRVFVCAHDVSPIWHVKMQAAFQAHTDNAVSKTVNFPNAATREEVAEVYMLAYRLGCKGVTIYRDGSRDEPGAQHRQGQRRQGGGQRLPPRLPECQGLPADGDILPRPRPEVTMGLTEKVKIGCGNLYITVNYDENGICEVFTNTGKAGGCPSQSEATARLVSIALRSGMDVEIIDQLKGIRCPSTIRQPGMKCTSCPDAIAKVIEKVADFQSLHKNEAIPFVAEDAQKRPAPTHPGAMKYCPECGAEMEHEGGCVSCRSCGYSKCN